MKYEKEILWIVELEKKSNKKGEELIFFAFNLNDLVVSYAYSLPTIHKTRFVGSILNKEQMA